MKTLQIGAYSPNFNDPRVISKIIKVVDWCKTYLSETSPKMYSKKQLQKVFGTQSNEFPAWLRANLLVRHGSYEVGGDSFKYTVRKEGIKKLESCISSSSNPKKSRQKKIDNIVVEKQIEILADTYLDDQLHRNIIYKEIDGRRYHPLQNIKREDKATFWKDTLPYDYDIEASLPTLIYQYAVKCGLDKNSIPTYIDYLENKSERRKQLASHLDISLTNSKGVFAALFNGAILSSSATHPCAILKSHLGLKEDINSAFEKMDKLKSNSYISSLRADIKLVWYVIKKEKLISGRFTSREKMKIYFSLEREVMDVVFFFLQKNGNFNFLEHDGFRTKDKVDLVKLQQLIKKKTGYEVKIEDNNLGGGEGRELNEYHKCPFLNQEIKEPSSTYYMSTTSVQNTQPMHVIDVIHVIEQVKT